MPDSNAINNPFLDDQNTTKTNAQGGSKFDPSTAKPVANTTPTLKDKNSKFDPSTAKAVDKGFGGHVRDLGASLMGGLAAVPDVAVGVADLYTGGRAGKAVDNLSDNFKLGEGQKYWQDQKTDHAKVQSKEFDDAEGIVDKTKVALSNPSMITNTVVESLPSMALGGLAGRGLNVASRGLINPVAAGAAGEGLVMAGAQAEQIRQKTDDGLLTGKQTAAAAGTGVAGSLLGFLGGTVARKLGFEDVDTLMARGVKPEQVAGEISQIPFSSIPKSVVLGAISEGLLEEMPQSVTEQVLQNYALDKDLFEGVDDAIVMGTLAGMAMGGTVAGTSQASKWAGQPNTGNPEASDDTDTNGSTPMLPAPTGGNGGAPGLNYDGLQGEYIPAGEQGATEPAQARQNFEYDQMSTDADNLINYGGQSPQSAPNPSEQMGLDPNLGPLSTAAATAVDSGMSQQMQIEMQAQAAAEPSSNSTEKTTDNNEPLQRAADAARSLSPEQIHGKQNTYGTEVTTAIEQLKQSQKGDQNAPITIDEGIQNGTTQQGNAPLNNGSQPVSEQNDTNPTSQMGTKTGAAQKGLQPAQSDAGRTISSNQSINEIQTSEVKSKLLGAQSKVTELEAQLATEKSVPKKAQIRKQIAELQSELSIQAQSDVNIDSPQKSTVENHRENFAKMDRSIAKVNAVRQRMREENPEIFTEANDRVRETHGLTNARVTAIADEIESSGSYELSDREYDKVKNNPNYKIDYNPKTFIGKVTAVKDQHSGEWVGNSEQSNGQSTAQINAGQVTQNEIQTSNNQTRVSELEAQLATEKSVPKKAQLRKQIAKLQEDNPIDQAAHAAATSIQNDLPEPTQAQIEAGNYKKGHIKVHGLDIAVENPRGSERRGTDPNGKVWAHTMSDHYGYLKLTIGADNENIDTYVGQNPESNQVFIVDQIEQQSGGFDEHKVMLGFDSQEDAIKAYKSNFDKGWKVGPVRAMNKDEFKSWLKDGDTKKPAGESAAPQPEATLDPQNVQRDYGDSLESVMSDVETLADDFTIDLHSVPKKRNALKNPNYHAVQHENGRVEILGMKHPATGEWVGKAQVQGKAPMQEQSKDIKSNSPEKTDSSSKAQSLNIQIQSDSALSHSIPSKLIDQAHKLGDVVNDLMNVKTDGVKTNVLYGKRLLAKIAKLNPDVQIHIVSDLNLIKDNTIRAGLVDGGYYVPAQNTSYIYPKSDAWESSVLELINHELVHSVSEQIIFDDLIPPKHDQKLNNIITKIGEYLFENSDLLSESSVDRLIYAFNTNPQHEVLAVGMAETEVRDSLKKILGNDGLLDLDGIFTAITEQFGNSNEQRKQSSNIGNGKKILHGTVPSTDTGAAGNLQDVSTGTENSKKRERSTGVDQTNLSTGEKQQGLINNDNGKIKQKGSENQSVSVSSTEENKVKQSDTDTPLYSRAKNQEVKGSTPEQVREALVKRFGEKTISSLEKRGLLDIISTVDEPGVEGFYQNGRVTLVASNLNETSIIPTFLHELGGHGGFQNTMDPEQYADLMGIFNDMVKRKHPLALEAKRLAERETDAKTQQLEYLPYLLTLASTQQEMNALQKSAIKRFIDKVVSAVKAWAFDRLGINLNLNENDMVALANRMVNQIGNQAQQNTDTNQNPLYSRSSDYSDITNRISNGLKNLPKTGDWINKKGVDWLGLGLGFLSRRHLTEIYGKLLPQLNKYNELAAQMDADKNDIAAGADNIVHEWSKLKDEEALANVMHDATLAQIDPAKPHQPGDDRVKYQQLLKAYNSLSPESQAMYKKARNAYSAHYAKVHEAIRDRILRSALSSQKKADLLKNIEGSFGQIKGVYFPLARFGEYIIVMRNKNGDVASVSRAETNNQAESIRSELMKKYPQFKVDPVKLDKEYSASRDGVGRGFMSDLFDEVGNLGLDKKAQAEFEDTLSQLYLSSMPDLSWAKHGIHRKGTAGFSQDARRAFAQHMFSGANYLGKLRYGDQLAQQLNDMQKHADEEFNKGENYDQRSAQRVISEMEKRHELLMNPKGHPLSSFLTSAGFMYYLGLSPAAAIVNLSQTALIAYPLMGAKWNYDKAGKELLKASSDFAKGVEFKVPDFSSLESFKNSIGDVYSPNIDKVIKGLELDAYNKAVKRGVIDVTQAHDLAGIAQGEDSKVMWYFRPAMRLASGMFHHAERFNREVTFIAAYRLASQAGASHTEAFDQAMDMVYKGHFDYSSGNRARFMQGNIAKVVLLFKQYAQNMLYTLLRNAHQSIYALDPKDQKEARRALAGILGMHALAAGAIGLPITGMLATASLLIAKKSKLGAAAFGVAALAALASGGDDDDPYELENVIRNWLADIHPTFADLVFGGVPRAFSPVDLSGRVGLNNLIIPDVQDGIEGADWANAYASALLGPVAGIGTNIAKGMQLMGEGHYRRGLESMLPVVIRNPIKAWRYADEGVLAKDGKVIQEDVGGVGLFSQAIGFSPSDVRTSMEGRSAIFAYRNKLSNGRKDLMDVWVNARQEDNSQGMEEAWTEILTYNQKVGQKNPSMRISRIQLMQRYKERERKNRDAGAGGVYLTKRERGAEEQGRFAFDE